MMYKFNFCAKYLTLKSKVKVLFQRVWTFEIGTLWVNQRRWNEIFLQLVISFQLWDEDLRNWIGRRTMHTCGIDTALAKILSSFDWSKRICIGPSWDHFAISKKFKRKCNVSFCRVHLCPQTYPSLIWSVTFCHQRILLKYLPAIKRKRVKQIEVIYGLAGFKTVFSSSSLVCKVPYPFFIVKSWLNRAGSFSCSFAFL